MLITSYREYLSIDSDVGLCRITHRGRLEPVLL
nr:MAG TPA: hypothetical protein [Caudoviricetes sp.]DAH48748.1 MAG TPA: hypothetical protein [Caudoviricetes sp.]DAV44442.1 MAG TPA: hypothetical protein [Caudoviricetes sp.]DAV82908.1 MAG TPA: hypothetical protein [Caudoviricetes sp.]DAZ54020.1 MAG TPA: hypothetical protein [Caudoviricetes sp.]